MARPGKLFLVFICLIASMVIVAPLPKAHATSNCATASNGQTQPTGYVTESPSSVTLGSSVSFTAHYTGCITTSVQWVQICFGDGNCDTVPGSDTHTYANTGTYSWSAQLFNQNSVAPTNPGSNGPLSGQITVSPMQWTNGDWSIEPSQTQQCLYYSGIGFDHNTNYCMGWRAEVKADGQEVNTGADYYQVTMRNYWYGDSIWYKTTVWDYDASISFSAPNPGGVQTIEPPTSQFALTQTPVTLTFADLSVQLLMPSQQSDCLSCNLNFAHWHVWSSTLQNVQGYYSEQGADISLPEGQTWTINFHFNTNHMAANRLGCSYVSPQCNFSWDGSITIPAGHVDPPPCSPNPCQQPPGPSPDYEMLTNPSSISLPQASNNNSTIFLTPQWGFSGSLGLTTSVTGPGSLILNFALPGSTWTGSSANVMVAPTQQANITLNIAAYTNTPSGTYTVTVSSNGPPAHSATITVTVSSCSCDFSISASPSTLTIYQGSSGGSTITLGSVNGLLGGISLSASAPSGISISLNTTRCAVWPGSTICGASATVVVSSSTATGAYTVTITGTASDLLHSVSIAVHVAVILSNNPSSTDWTILKGTWTEQNGVIDATTSSSTTDPIMRSTGTFASDRTVTVRAITITAGSNAYNTAWIGGKYVDSSNSIIMILHTDGKVELQFKQNGVQSSYTTGSTGLSPFVWHTFQMVFSGNTVSAYVDGTLYLTVTNSLVGSLGAAHISLESHGAPESQFDSATIT